VLDTIGKLLSKGHIQPSRSDWCHRIRPVVEHDGSIRLKKNFIRLNQIVPLDKYSLPKISEILAKLRDQAFFSKIGLEGGFFSGPFKEGR
jgi:hypothetical protein